MRSKVAFDVFRENYGPAQPPVPERIRNQEELKPMTPGDGLLMFADGPIETAATPTPAPPRLARADITGQHLWAVRQEDVVYADELCPFGRTLETRVIKHTNLTGGAPAYAGGELIWRDEQTLIVNGRSGRYGVRSADEMAAVCLAFRKSGYHVWSMGYDTEADFPFPFVGVTPQWIL